MLVGAVARLAVAGEPAVHATASQTANTEKVRALQNFCHVLRSLRESLCIVLALAAILLVLA